jgi:hypothetical protein
MMQPALSSDAFANKLLSVVHLRYFSAYIYTAVTVKSLELSCVQVDVQRCWERS